MHPCKLYIRADNDKLRSKIAKHKGKYKILRDSLPTRKKSNALYKVVAKEVDETQYGIDPYNKRTAAATGINILLALIASGLAGYIAYNDLGNWDSDESIGLGVTLLVLMLIPSVTGVIEESQKKVNLEKIDGAYKDKIKSMKTYFFDKKDLSALKNYHELSQDIPQTLKLTKYSYS